MKLSIGQLYRIQANELMDPRRTWTSAKLDAFHRRNRAIDKAMQRGRRKPQPARKGK